MSAENSDALVSTAWLAEHLSDTDLRILDCTWHHISSKMDGRTQYRGRHLPGSVHFDIDHICDKSSLLPHMLPIQAEFAHKVGLLGVGDGDRIVVYDRHCGGAAAARAWWMFRVFGYHNVWLLDGGYGKWRKEELPTNMTAVRPENRKFGANYDPLLVRDIAFMKANIGTGAEQVLDARGPGKFDGSQDDVFPVKKKGHIPNAINIPWGDLIDEESGTYLAAEAIKARFDAAGVDLSKPIVTTCASGITSCSLALGLYLIGYKNAAVYDGSWAEWGQADDTPAVAA
jgi:thiosulfate/3-mercaptopyruvate sulfurtransferase